MGDSGVQLDCYDREGLFFSSSGGCGATHGTPPQIESGTNGLIFLLQSGDAHFVVLCLLDRQARR